MSFDSYRDWLQTQWSLTLQVEDAEQEPAHDPRMKSVHPLERLGLEEPARADQIQADHSTASFVSAMRKMKDRFSLGQIWEIGCGSGIIAVEAGRLGAIQICATDVDDEAVELTRRNGEAHGLRIQSVQADLFRGVPWKGPFDLLLSILPQKPCLPGMLPLANDGGPEGTKLLLPLIEEAPSWLKPSGELMIFIHSLAHPEAICRLHRRYDVTIISIKRRIFSRDEFSGLIDFWEERRNGNLCYFEEEQRDQFAFITMILKARPKR